MYFTSNSTKKEVHNGWILTPNSGIIISEPKPEKFRVNHFPVDIVDGWLYK